MHVGTSQDRSLDHANRTEPPSTLKVIPVMNAESSLAMNTATCAQSSGWPARPRGVSRSSSQDAFSVRATTRTR